MDMKQTAVEFAVEKLEKFIPSGNQIAIFSILQQAKEMHKEEIMDAYEDGEDNAMNYHSIPNFKDITAEQYYNQTYNK